MSEIAVLKSDIKRIKQVNSGSIIAAYRMIDENQ
jgi:hypothetical protein